MIASRVQSFSPDALQAMINYPFPGNIRELEHMVERIMHLCKGESVNLEDLPREIVDPGHTILTLNMSECANGQRSFSKMMEEAEERFIRWAMKKAGGNQSQASRLLDIPRTTLQEKIKRFNIE